MPKKKPVRKNRWIQGAANKHTKGALHRQLGIPEGRKIPKAKLHRIMKTPVGQKVGRHKVTALLKKRANFALNVQKRK